MIAYAVFILCIVLLYLNHLSILEKMNRKRDYDPNKVLGAALIIVAGVALLIAFLNITDG